MRTQLERKHKPCSLTWSPLPDPLSLSPAGMCLADTRWCLAHTLERQHWVYSANNLLLLGSWVWVRLLHAPYFLFFRIADTCAVTHGPLGLYTAMGFTTYGLMIAMSAIWLAQLTKNCLRSFLVLDKGAKNAGAVPAFGSRARRRSKDLVLETKKAD